MSVYFYRVAFFLGVPAGILSFSESDFVNEIVKFWVGYPLYSDQTTNDSFPYTAGAPLVT